jgi:inosine-uridine nucleoside N-ribohydrolase
MLVPAAIVAGEGVKILFDTDIGPDCDDAGAAAALHVLMGRGECEILGMACCTSNEYGAPCLDAINTFYGRPDIPIGTLKDGPFCAWSPYNEDIAKNFPNDLQNGGNAPDATAMYRRILSEQPDGSVTIVATGPLRNMGNMLNSGPDGSSDLNGNELIARKVRELVIMGGGYPNGAEWNFQQDGGASNNVASHWPTPIMYSGAEIGDCVFTGARFSAEMPVSNPVRKAYEDYVGAGERRQSWDITAAVYAVRGLRNYWLPSPGGSNQVSGDGANSFQASESGTQGYLLALMHPTDMEKTLEDLMIGVDEGPVPEVPVPLNKLDWTATASSNDQGVEPGMGIDYKFGSRWTSGRQQAPGLWYAVDMKTRQKFDRIVLDCMWDTGDYPRGYEVLVSDDGAAWGNAVCEGSGSGNSPLTEMKFETCEARHIKIALTKNAVEANWFTIHELSVYCSEDTGGTTETVMPAGASSTRKSGPVVGQVNAAFFGSHGMPGIRIFVSRAAHPGPVIISLYNQSGQRVGTATAAHISEGRREGLLNRRLAPGRYICGINGR